MDGQAVTLEDVWQAVSEAAGLVVAEVFAGHLYLLWAEALSGQ